MLVKLLTAVGMIGLVLVAYWPVQQAPLLYEDAQLLDQAQVRLPSVGDLPGRYVTNLTVAFDWRRGGQAALHQTNLLIHLLNGWLVYLLARRLRWTLIGAWVAAGIFLLHPIQTEAVSYLSARTDLLVTTAALIACLVFVRNQWAIEDQAAIIVIGLLAFATKESGVTLLALLPLLAWRLRVEWRCWVIAWMGLLGLAVLMGAPMVLTLNDGSVVNPMRYAAMQLTAVWTYLSLTLWPSGFSIEHDMAIWPTSLHLLALVSTIALVGIVVVQRRRYSVLAFCVGWIICTIWPRLLVRLPDLLNEHQFYLPFVGVCLGLGAVIGAVERAESAAWDSLQIGMGDELIAVHTEAR